MVATLSRTLLAAFCLPFLIAAQLTGLVGPLTTIAQKQGGKTCNVRDYGAKADRVTDLGPPLTAAFAACKTGGLVIIPQGNYVLNTWVNLSGGSAWALQLDGIIYRSGTAAGNMIMIQHTSDFEMFSSTGKGAVQGNGYEFHAKGDRNGPRILRLYDAKRFSVHDLALVDSPLFHLVMDTCSDGEVYNLLVRGADWGGVDGVDVWGTNIWIHDVEVTNKDECITVKSPAKNILIENVYCNRSGGCAIGSLGVGTDISNIVYRNVYTSNSNQMMMIKSNGGSGNLDNVVFENFIGHGNAYSLNIDQYWESMSALAGDGVQLHNLTFNNWKGTEANGLQRGPIRIRCADKAPCTDITIQDLAMWTETGTKQWYSCRNAYGLGFCLKPDTAAAVSYAAVTTTVSVAPAGYTALTMERDLTAGFGTTVSIPNPSMPVSFYPGVKPFSKIAGSS